MARRTLFATSNPHKLRELREILSPLGVEVLGLDQVGGDVPEPVEDGDTFEANAQKKAVGYAAALGLPCLAEDSGLEVDALGGAPGVHSARYSGVEGDRDTRDAANNEKLLAAMKDVPDGERAARFVAAICLVDATGAVLFETRGTYEGQITFTPAGDNGFGYDPLLFLPDVDKTSAELTSEEKHARSHRGVAARALAAWLEAHPEALT